MKLRMVVGAAMVGGVMLVGAPAMADEAPATAPAAAVAPPSEAASASTSTSTSTTADAPAASKRTVWPWIIMGSGVALIATAIVLEVNAVRQDDKRESDEIKLTGLGTGGTAAERAALNDSIKDHDDSASSGRTAALIVGTVGFLAVAGSVVLWFIEGSSSAPAPTPQPVGKPRPTFTPALSPSYAGASLGLSF